MSDVSPETLRKRKERETKKAMGISTVELQLSKKQLAHLDRMCQARAVGHDSPYSRAEYLMLLLQRDEERYQQQITTHKACEKCGEKLPGGCGGLFKGDASCLHSWPNYKEFNL